MQSVNVPIAEKELRLSARVPGFADLVSSGGGLAKSYTGSIGSRPASLEALYREQGMGMQYSDSRE